MKRLIDRLATWLPAIANEWTWLYPHRIWCFFAGHEVFRGETYNYEPDYCSRCFMDWPQEATDMPKLLNVVYVWAVEHGFPEWLDLRLGKHIRLPDWWRY